MVVETARAAPPPGSRSPGLQPSSRFQVTLADGLGVAAGAQACRPMAAARPRLGPERDRRSDRRWALRQHLVALVFGHPTAQSPPCSSLSWSLAGATGVPASPYGVVSSRLAGVVGDAGQPPGSRSWVMRTRGPVVGVQAVGGRPRAAPARSCDRSKARRRHGGARWPPPAVPPACQRAYQRLTSGKETPSSYPPRPPQLG